jgi:hypothetical protein
MQNKTNLSRSLLCGLAGCLLLFIGGVAFSNAISPVDLGKIYSVQNAQSMDEVQQLIGPPSRAGNRTDTGTVSWFYSDPIAWHEFRVDFSDSGRVIRCVFDD